nr:hypothetical protein [Tanacetum cinerariifolium]
MTLTFAETHNTIAYLTKSDASEGFNHIIDFLNGSSNKYALIVNPNIYVSCIKQFWTTVAVKTVDDVIRLQALVDKKKVVKVFANMQRVGKGFSKVETPLFEGMLVAQEVSKGDAEVHDENINAGDAAEGDVSLAHREVPNVDEEPSIPSPTPPTPPSQPSQDIPSTSQVQPTPPRSPRVQQQSPQPQPQPQQDAGIPMNLLQDVMDTCTTLSRRVEHLELDKIAQALEISKLKKRVKKLERRNKVKVLKLKRMQKARTTQRVETSDETMMDDVSNQGRMIAKMDQDADVVLEKVKEVAEDAKVDAGVDIQGRKAESQEEIYKIDLGHTNKVLSMQEDKTEPTKVQEVVDVVTTAKIIIEFVTTASETITADEAQVPVVTLTAAPARVAAAPSRRRKGVVIKDPQEESTTSTIILAKTKPKDKGKGILVEAPKPLKKQQQIEQDEKYARELEAEDTEKFSPSTIIPAETKSKDKGKGILVEEPKPLEKQAQIEQDEKYAREMEAKLNRNIDWDEAIDHVNKKAKEDPAVKRYQALKRKPQTEAQARKNMIVYLKNVAGFKIDYFKGMSYDDIRPIFEAKFNSNVAFL